MGSASEGSSSTESALPVMLIEVPSFPFSPFSPFGILNRNLASFSVPTFSTAADSPGCAVTTSSTETVAEKSPRSAASCRSCAAFCALLTAESALVTASFAPATASAACSVMLTAATFAAVDSVFTFSAREIMLPLTSSP